MALRFDVLTLFPELFAPFLHAGITRRAWADGQMRLKLWNPRDWAEGRYRRVDDRPFGGGPGMVMLAEPLARCLAAAQADRLASGPQSGQPHEAGQGAEQESAPVPVVLFSPTGPRLNHAAVQSWAASRGAILICGRYEGIDQRFIDRHEVWQGQSAPAELLSGHHARIEQWRRAQSLQLTARQRPDLLAAARAAGCLTAQDEQTLAALNKP